MKPYEIMEKTHSKEFHTDDEFPPKRIKKVVCHKVAPYTLYSYKWSYNPYKWPYKWVTGVMKPYKWSAFTVLITGDRAHLAVVFFFLTCECSAATSCEFPGERLSQRPLVKRL